MAALIRFRGAIATVIALSSLLVVTAPPAAAETGLVSCTGTCGAWQVQDTSANQGAVCIYHNKQPHVLYEVTVRPPVMYGYYSTKDEVDWFFKIQHRYAIGTQQKFKTISTSADQ